MLSADVKASLGKSLLDYFNDPATPTSVSPRDSISGVAVASSV